MGLFKRSRHQAAVDPLNDALTGCATRRRLDRDIQLHPNASGSLMTVMMIEVDHFVRFAELHGHEISDDVLRRVADIVHAEVREGDTVYRYDRQQFCILLGDTSEAEAGLVAERIRFAVFCMDLSISDSVTVSIGMAAIAAPQIETAVQRADAALDRSRRDGHDRITLVTVDEHERSRRHLAVGSSSHRGARSPSPGAVADTIGG